MRKKLRLHDGFDEDNCCPGLVGHSLVTRSGFGRYHDGGCWAICCWPQFAQKAISVKLGHVDVHDVKIERCFECLFQGLNSVPCLFHQVTCGFENAAVIHAHCGCIVDDQMRLIEIPGLSDKRSRREICAP